VLILKACLYSSTRVEARSMLQYHHPQRHAIRHVMCLQRGFPPLWRLGCGLVGFLEGTLATSSDLLGGHTREGLFLLRSRLWLGDSGRGSGFGTEPDRSFVQIWTDMSHQPHQQLTRFLGPTARICSSVSRHSSDHSWLLHSSLCEIIIG
jgi:hypothetical protein